MLWVVMPGSGAAWRWAATRGPRCCLEGTAWRLSTAPAPCWELVPSHCGEADDQGWFWGCAGLGEGAHLIPTFPRSPSAPWHGRAELRVSPGAGGAQHFNSVCFLLRGRGLVSGILMAPAAAESAANPPAPAGHRVATGTGTAMGGGHGGVSEQKMELSQHEAPRGPLGAGLWARGHRAGVAAEGTRFVPGDGCSLGAPLGARSLETRGGGRCWGDGTDPSHGQGSWVAPCAHPAGL